MRKGFNFYRSYYDVFKELPDKDKLLFIKALLDKQFDGKDPNLKGMAKFAYLSQKHSIDSQVKGYEDKTGVKLTPTVDPMQGGSQGGSVAPSVQGKGEVQEEGKGEEEEEAAPSIENPFSENFIPIWDQWKEYKKTQFKFKYKAVSTEQASLTDLLQKSGGIEQTAIEIIHQSIANGWKGFFELKNNNKNSSAQIEVDVEKAKRATEIALNMINNGTTY